MLSASVGLGAGGGGSAVTVGGGCCSVVRASSFSPSSRRSTAASAPPATSNTTTAPTAIQRQRRFPAAGGARRRLDRRRRLHGRARPRGVSDVERCGRGGGPVSRRQRRAAAPAVPRALGLLVAAARTGQRRRAVPRRCGHPALGRRERRAAVSAEPGPLRLLVAAAPAVRHSGVEPSCLAAARAEAPVGAALRAAVLAVARRRRCGIGLEGTSSATSIVRLRARLDGGRGDNRRLPRPPGAVRRVRRPARPPVAARGSEPAAERRRCDRRGSPGRSR